MSKSFAKYRAVPLFHAKYINQSNANSVDPDQRAPVGALWSRPALFAMGIILFILLMQELLYIHVLVQMNFRRYYFYFLPDQAQILLIISTF